MAQVLVVDDYDATHALTRRVLGRAGHTTVHAENAADALDLLRHNQVDAMVVDIAMPHVDGIQFVQLLRSDPTLPTATPVVFYSAFIEVSNARRRVTDLESVTLVAKDGDIEELIRAVDGAIHHSSDPDVAPVQPAIVVQLRPGVTVISVDRSGERVFQLWHAGEVLLESVSLEEIIQRARATKLD